MLPALLVAGCGGGASPVPPDNYYRLKVAPPETPVAKAALNGILSVDALDGDGLVRSRPMLFSMGAGHEAVRQHNYHHWADSPTKLVQGQLAAFLKDSAVARSVVTPEMRVRSDYELMGRVLKLERIIGSGTPRVAAELELAVIRQSDRKLLLVQTYEAEIPCDDDSVDASVTALNTALRRIFTRFTADLTRTASNARG